jgi:hypothetical protein
VCSGGSRRPRGADGAGTSGRCVARPLRPVGSGGVCERWAVVAGLRGSKGSKGGSAAGNLQWLQGRVGGREPAMAPRAGRRPGTWGAATPPCEQVPAPPRERGRCYLGSTGDAGWVERGARSPETEPHEALEGRNRCSNTRRREIDAATHGARTLHQPERGERGLALRLALEPLRLQPLALLSLHPLDPLHLRPEPTARPSCSAAHAARVGPGRAGLHRYRRSILLTKVKCTPLAPPALGPPIFPNDCARGPTAPGLRRAPAGGRSRRGACCGP